ncbi:hypothetical protein F5148DRAFT_957630, partial [Russula earlei]
PKTTFPKRMSPVHTYPSLTCNTSNHSSYCSMGQLIIINTPASFTAIWSMVKLWLALCTLNKITILSANHPDQQHTALLLDLVLPENLPIAL